MIYTVRFLALANCFGVLVYCRVLTLVSKNMCALLVDDFPVTAWAHISLSKTHVHDVLTSQIFEKHVEE